MLVIINNNNYRIFIVLIVIIRFIKNSTIQGSISYVHFSHTQRNYMFRYNKLHGMFKVQDVLPGPTLAASEGIRVTNKAVNENVGSLLHFKALL